MHLAGFKKWDDLKSASATRLELGRLFIENRDKSPSIVDEWEMYLNSSGLDNIAEESELELFQIINM